MILKDLFDGQVRWMMRGVARGDASARAADAREKLCEAAADAGASRVLCMNVAFEHRVIDASDGALIHDGSGESGNGLELLAAQTPADGILIERPGDAVFFANADCPVGVLYDRVRQRAVVMHLGFGSLWKLAQPEPFLIERAFETLGGDPATMAFFGGGGIGPCCYGVQRQSEADHAREDYLDKLLPGRAAWRSKFGPRADQPSLDLGEIIGAQVRALGVEDFRYDTHCTSCSGMSDPNAGGFGTYFSNVRDRTRKLERNLTHVTLLSSPL